MLVRTVTLIFLMIVSPFAFLGFALPVGGGWGNTWLNKLIGSTFVAPAFLAMLYLDSIIINSLDVTVLTGGTNASLAGAFTGAQANYSIFLNFFFLIVLLLASLKVASSVSSGAGEQGSSWAKKGLGMASGAAFSGGAAGGRQLGGRFGKMTAESKTLQKMASSNSRFTRTIGNLGLASGEKMKKGTWDPRNAGANRALALGGINAGTGSKRSYETSGGVLSSVTKGYRGTEKEKELIDKSKARFAKNPGARKDFLTDRGVDLDASRNKDVNKEIKSDLRTQESKSKATELMKDHKADIERAEKKEITQEQLAESEKDVAAKLGTLLGVLTAKEKIDFLSEEQLRMSPVIRSLQGADLTALGVKSAELEPATIAAINAGIVSGGTESARRQMKNQTTLGGAFSYDAEANLAALTKDYDTQKTALGEGSDAFKTYASKQKVEIKKALGMAGSAESIKDMADTVITHEAVVASYNKKVAGELRKKLADSNTELSKEFDEKLSKLNEHYTSTSEQDVARRANETYVAQMNAQRNAAASSRTTT